jgi:acyl-CoA synthetase (AMP-forming)/AMP-acid ligase II
VRPERLFFKHGDLCCNNRDFNDLINLMAHALMATGIRKGDLVAVLMINCSTLLDFFSCAKNATFIATVSACQ